MTKYAIMTDEGYLRDGEGKLMVFDSFMEAVMHSLKHEIAGSIEAIHERE